MNTKVFLISYDLGFPSRMYKTLDTLIEETFPNSVRVLGSVWLVSSSLDASAILQSLKKALDGDDKMLVIPVAPDWTHWRLDAEHVQWLQSHLSE